MLCIRILKDDMFFHVVLLVIIQSPLVAAQASLFISKSHLYMLTIKIKLFIPESQCCSQQRYTNLGLTAVVGKLEKIWCSNEPPSHCLALEQYLAFVLLLFYFVFVVHKDQELVPNLCRTKRKNCYPSLEVSFWLWRNNIISRKSALIIKS